MLFDKVVELVGGGSVVNRAYPVMFSNRKAFFLSKIIASRVSGL